LPYLRRDGERNPEVDADAWDARRLGRLRSAVSALATAYRFSGEPYAEHAARLLRVFFLDAATRMNPNLRYAQAVPGRNDGRSTGIIETATLPELLDRVTLLEASPAWSANDRAGLDACAPPRERGRRPCCSTNHGADAGVQSTASRRAGAVDQAGARERGPAPA
jgi:hypothetical protein